MTKNYVPPELRQEVLSIMHAHDKRMKDLSDIATLRIRQLGPEHKEEVLDALKAQVEILVQQYVDELNAEHEKFTEYPRS